MKATILSLDGTLKLFGYGDPGSGKTTLGGSLENDPRTSPCLWLNSGGNPQSLRNNKHLPDIFTIEKFSDLNPVYNWLKSGQSMATTQSFPKLAAELGILLRPPYKSIVIDGFTELQRIRVSEIVGYAGKGPGDNIPRTEIQHWGDALNSVVFATRLFYELPLTVYVTSLEKTKEDQALGTQHFMPLLWGQADKEVPAYSMMTIRLVRRQNMPIADKKKVPDDTHCIAYIDQVGRFLAKDQYSTGVTSIPNPTMTDILDAVYGKMPTP